MKHDMLGRMLLAAVHAYLLANKPTAALTSVLINDFLGLIVHHEGVEVRIQIGDAPAITRQPQ